MPDELDPACSRMGARGYRHRIDGPGCGSHQSGSQGCPPATQRERPLSDPDHEGKP